MKELYLRIFKGQRKVFVKEWTQLKEKHGEWAWRIINSNCINNLAVDKKIEFSGFVITNTMPKLL